MNFELNGRSSKSFRGEKRWEPVLAAKPDYILLQFGHNDACPTKLLAEDYPRWKAGIPPLI